MSNKVFRISVQARDPEDHTWEDNLSKFLEQALRDSNQQRIERLRLKAALKLG